MCMAVEVPRLTVYAVDWADLVTLDLGQYDAPGGKQRLAAQLRDAVHHVGFLYVQGPALRPTHLFLPMYTATLPTSGFRNSR